MWLYLYFINPREFVCMRIRENAISKTAKASDGAMLLIYFVDFFLDQSLESALWRNTNMH